MSAQVAQTQTEALPANHIRSAFEVTDINKPWDTPSGHSIHVFEPDADTSLCGHVDADTHPTSIASDADHDHRLTYDIRVCDHCARSVRKRVRERDLTTGHDNLDAIIRTEQGDELTVETPKGSYTFTVQEVGFNIKSMRAKGSTDRDGPEGCEYWCDNIQISVEPDGTVEVRHPYNVLEGPDTTTGTVVTDSQTAVMADGGKVIAKSADDELPHPRDDPTIKYCHKGKRYDVAGSDTTFEIVAFDPETLPELDGLLVIETVDGSPINSEHQHRKGGVSRKVLGEHTPDDADRAVWTATGLLSCIRRLEILEEDTGSYRDYYWERQD